MKKFFRENFAVIAGVALPLALALAFFLATRISAAGIDPPRTPVLYASNYFDYQNNLRYEFKVRDGRVHVYYQPSDPKAHVLVPILQIFDPVSGEVREIVLPESDSVKKVELIVPELTEIQISSKLTSPDGFIFDSGHRNYNLMTEIFGGGAHNRGGVFLRKGGYRMPIPGTRDNNEKFLGWIVKDGR
ncbi:MAG: hypothetical protein ACOY17_02885 [Pseudomonadota bacterium]